MIEYKIMKLSAQVDTKAGDSPLLQIKPSRFQVTGNPFGRKTFITEGPANEWTISFFDAPPVEVKIMTKFTSLDQALQHLEKLLVSRTN